MKANQLLGLALGVRLAELRDSDEPLQSGFDPTISTTTSTALTSAWTITSKSQKAGLVAGSQIGTIVPLAMAGNKLKLP
jgi:hypothetical protein